MSEQAPVLVVLPRASGLDRPSNVDDQWKRADRAENLLDWAQRVMIDPQLDHGDPGPGESYSDSDGPNFRWSVIGRPSSDVVMAAPVPSLALYDETKLATALKTRVDRISGCLYDIEKSQKTEYNEGRKLKPMLVDPLATSTTVTDDIAAWLEGWKDRQFDKRAEAWSARMYTMNKYQGTLRSVAPTAAIATGLGG